MAIVGDKTENYFDEAYWNNRYTRDSGSFDWYQHYGGIAPLIKMYAKTTDGVLMVGCGSAHKKMDVRCMKEFEDKSFHCVLDKGMLDNLMCGASAQACVASMLSEVYRLLKPGGIYFLISYGDPRSRMAYVKTKHLPWENIILHAIRM